jgi:hypothetical protein
MPVRCKVCGKPLRDAMSIARGMGPKCAGVSSAGRSIRSHVKGSGETIYMSSGTTHAITSLFTYVEERQTRLPETLRRYPSDLVDLVLSAPAAGSIGRRIKHSSHKRQANPVHPAKMLKQIRRMYIEFRVLFWPGIFNNLEAIPCIPYGENDWRIGENGKVCSKDELVSYLSRYGMISPQVSD